MDGGHNPNRDGEPVLPKPGRAGGGIGGSGAVKYLENGKFYLIESTRDRNKYLFVEALEDGSSFALEVSSSHDENAIYLYDKTFENKVVKTFNTGEELGAFFDEMAEWITNYNGQSAYFERTEEEIEPRKVIILP